MDYSHLNALYLILMNECERLNASKTEAEKELHLVRLEQINEQIKSERKILGFNDDLADEITNRVLLDMFGNKRCRCGALFSVHETEAGKFQPTNCQGFVLKTDDDHYP